MANEKLRLLAKKIADRTMAGELSWEQTTKENIFTVSFPKYSVTILEIPETEEFSETYSLSVFNESGRLLDTLNDQEARVAGISLSQVFQRAREIALGVDEALDELLGN